MIRQLLQLLNILLVNCALNKLYYLDQNYNVISNVSYISDSNCSVNSIPISELGILASPKFGTFLNCEYSKTQWELKVYISGSVRSCNDFKRLGSPYFSVIGTRGYRGIVAASGKLYYPYVDCGANSTEFLVAVQTYNTPQCMDEGTSHTLNNMITSTVALNNLCIHCESNDDASSLLIYNGGTSSSTCNPNTTNLLCATQPENCLFVYGRGSTGCYTIPTMSVSLRVWCGGILPPTAAPTIVPTQLLTTGTQTQVPTQNPTIVPTVIPTVVPTQIHTIFSSQLPTKTPTVIPTQMPSAVPTMMPSTKNPTVIPTQIPSAMPSTNPPTLLRTTSPTIAPTFITNSLENSMSYTKMLGVSVGGGIIGGIITICLFMCIFGQPSGNNRNFARVMPVG